MLVAVQRRSLMRRERLYICSTTYVYLMGIVTIMGAILRGARSLTIDVPWADFA